MKEKKSLRDFVESLEKAIGSVHVESINIEGVHHSTVTVLCSIPRWMKGAFKRTMKEKERALREQDIFSVEIDEEEMLQVHAYITGQKKSFLQTLTKLGR